MIILKKTKQLQPLYATQFPLTTNKSVIFRN